MRNRSWCREGLNAASSTYAYNLANELVAATVGSTTQTYTYSGDGVRLSAATGSQAARTTQYVVDRAFALPTVVAERDGSGKLLRRYVYGLALLDQTTSNKGPYWYHEDGLGSVSDITSSAGTPLWWAERDILRLRLDLAGPGQPLHVHRAVPGQPHRALLPAGAAV